MNGVAWYTKVTVCFEYFFPEGKADCRHCEFCRYRENFGIYQCLLARFNNEIPRPELDTRAPWCPMSLEETPF